MLRIQLDLERMNQKRKKQKIEKNEEKNNVVSESLPSSDSALQLLSKASFKNCTITFQVSKQRNIGVFYVRDCFISASIQSWRMNCQFCYPQYLDAEKLWKTASNSLENVFQTTLSSLENVSQTVGGCFPKLLSIKLEWDKQNQQYVYQ